MAGGGAGPGTLERHEHYLGLVERLPIPDACVVGNFDLDDAGEPTPSRASMARRTSPRIQPRPLRRLHADVQAFDRAGTAERRFGEAPAA